MKLYFRLCLLVLALAALMRQISPVPAPTRAAGPWYVAPGGNDSNTCASAGAACATINGAIAKASPGDTVLVAIGMYTGAGAEVVLLNKDVTLSGGWDMSFTTQSGMSSIDGGGARQGITVNSGVTAVVERFIMQNGLTGGDGGGIVNRGTTTLNNSIVTSNMAGNGGGIYNTSGSHLSLSNSTINNNIAGGSGGGIFNDLGGVITMTTSTVSGNTASASSGGGIYNHSTLLVINSTIGGNRAGYSGGGIQNVSPIGMVTLNNSTISGNTGSLYGGGIYNVSGGRVTIQNTILAGNMAGPDYSSGPDCYSLIPDPISSAGYNLIGSLNSCDIATTTGDLTNVDPKLGPLQGSPGYHPLLSGSPAIDAGNPAGCTDHLGNPLNTDQRGMPRAGRCDIGAYEFGLNTATKQVVGNYTPGESLTYIITLDNDANTNLTGVSITDTLPISLTYVPGSFSASNGTGGENGGVITWNGSVPANGSTMVSFQATIDANVPNCSIITNKALVSGGAGYGFEVETTGATPCVCNPSKAPGNPVLPIGPNGAWDDDDVWGPSVLKEGSSYKMWYSGYDGANSRIGLATSSDGLNWIKDAGIRF